VDIDGEVVTGLLRRGEVIDGVERSRS